MIQGRFRLTRTDFLNRTRQACGAAGRPKTYAGAAACHPANRLILLCALALALLWQGFITQTHQHRPVELASSQLERNIAGKSGRGDPAPDSPGNCPICVEAASAGPALLPTPVVVAAPATRAFFTAAFRPQQFQRTSRSHVWQSRAPPHRLQA
jgi:hypothetical protein